MGEGVQSVERTLALLEALAAVDAPLGVSELSARTRLPHATIHRLLATLAEAGYVQQERAGKRYLLGSALLRLGAATTRVLGSWAQPYLEEMAEATGESANLAVLEGDHVVYLAQAQSRRMVRMFTEVGNRVPPHATAVGKVLLAPKAPSEVVALAERTGLPARTPNTITDLDRFLAELDRVAHRGYALDDEEAEIGVRCVAVPVGPEDHARGEPIAAVSVSGPAGRLGPPQREAILAAMRRTARRMAGKVPQPRV